MKPQPLQPLYLYTGRGPEAITFVKRITPFLVPACSLRGARLGVGLAPLPAGRTPLVLNGGAKTPALDSVSMVRTLRSAGLTVSGVKQGAGEPSGTPGRTEPAGAAGTGMAATAGQPEMGRRDSRNRNAEEEAAGGFFRRFEVTVFHLQAVHIAELGVLPGPAGRNGGLPAGSYTGSYAGGSYAEYVAGYAAGYSGFSADRPAESDAAQFDVTQSDAARSAARQGTDTRMSGRERDRPNRPGGNAPGAPRAESPEPERLEQSNPPYRQGQTRSSGLVLIGPEPGSRFYRRLEKLAVRALYALGLDFGEVLLESAGGMFSIGGISPLPRFRAPEAAALFAEAAKRTADEWAEAALARPAVGAATGTTADTVADAATDTVADAVADIAANTVADAAAKNAADLAGSALFAARAQAPYSPAASNPDPGLPGVQIGMDPEFLLYDRSLRKVIPASRFFPRAGKAGCDAVWIGGRPRFPLAELRPGPAASPEGAIRLLMDAMREADRMVADKSLAWLAGGQPQRGLPLGGHLHFSGVPLTARLLRALDSYLALPLLMLEPAGSRARRPRYGRLGDFRRQSYGGFEYRTLPSFLVSPLAAKGAVALGLLIAEEAERLPDDSLPLAGAGLTEAFYAGDRTLLGSAALQAIREIEAWPGYTKYDSYIAPLLKAVRSGETWDETRDIRGAWRIGARGPRERPDVSPKKF